MSSDNNIQSLITGGLLGAALGAWLSKDKDDGAMIGAIIGAALSATLKANKEAQKTDQPVLIAEKGKLYKLLPHGEREFIREIPRNSRSWPEHFKLH